MTIELKFEVDQDFMKIQILQKECWMLLVSVGVYDGSQLSIPSKQGPK